MSIPILSVAQMREWESASWAGGRSPDEVIAEVGRQVAQRALQLTASNDRVLILAGKGNNGRDAQAAESPLIAQRRVTVFKIADPATQLPALLECFKPPPALVIDGMFGIGLNRPLDPAWIELIDEVNHLAPSILSIDVPSGLNAETGEPMGAAIEADITLTVGAPKEGLVQRQSYRYVGRLETLTDVGLVPLRETKPSGDENVYVTSARYSWTTAEDFADFPPCRRIDAHKGNLGHATIIAGSIGYHGAAVLSAHGALHARPGLVTLFTPENVYGPIAAQLSAAMVHPWYRSKDLPQTATALLIGPGLAAAGTKDVLADVVNIYWQHIPVPVIVDASALDWLQPGRTPLSSRRVITPHPGEAARMLETKVETVQQNRFAALKELSSRFGNCWVVLKGHQTLVGRSSGELYINSSGNPDMAQGGAGDVLAGFLTGLLAQPRLQSDPLKAIRYAVWKHGATADALSLERPGWVIADLVEALNTGKTPIAR